MSCKIFTGKSPGVTLWEMYTLGNVPYPNDSWNKEFTDRIEAGTTLDKPKYALPEM
jgi:hypothetical protein